MPGPVQGNSNPSTGELKPRYRGGRLPPQGNRDLRTGEPEPPYRVSPGISRSSREGREDPPYALKGHSGVLACGGVSHKADDIPAPTRTAPVNAVPPPLPTPIYRWEGVVGVGVGMSRRHPNARSPADYFQHFFFYPLDLRRDLHIIDGQ